MTVVSVQPAARSGDLRGVRKLGEELLDQQLWFLGQDIGHAEGNLLLEYGFSRSRPPAGTHGSSVYQLAGSLTASGDTLVCWGFATYLGVVAGEPSPPRLPIAPAGVLLRRHTFTPALTAHALRLPVWRLQELPASLAARTEMERAEGWRRLGALARTFADYERWALARVGADGRLRGLALRPRAVRRVLTIPCLQLADAWHALAADCDGLAATARSARPTASR